MVNALPFGVNLVIWSSGYLVIQMTKRTNQ
jgi:hypothetical protein